MSVAIALSPVTAHYPMPYNRYRLHVTVSSQATCDMLMSGTSV
jgi:hypothetical protein